MNLEVPELVRQRAQANGEAGREWLDDLPGVLAAISDLWGLHLEEPYAGGTAGYVVRATDMLGMPCVLKVAMALDAEEEDAFHRSVAVHKLVGGRGCAKLLAHEPSVPALLMEQLGPNLDDLAFNVPQMLDTVTQALKAFWRPRGDAELDLPTGAEKAMWLAGFIDTAWSQLEEPCSKEIIAQALDYCEHRAAAFDPGGAVLVHGDAHGWNTVQATDGQYKLVDPEGVWSEPAQDLGVLMREYNEPLLAGDTARLTRARAEHLANLGDVDPEAVWQWGFIERVSTGLAGLRDFDGDESLAFLEVAQRCLSCTA